MTYQKSIWAAAAGGASPVLLYLAVSMTRPNAEWPTFTFIFGVALYAVLGGLVGWVSAEADLRKAFFLGIGLPALINTGVNGATEKAPTSNPPRVQARNWSLITSAHAAELVFIRTNAPSSRTNGVASAAPFTGTNWIVSILPAKKLGDVWFSAKDAQGKVIQRWMIDSGEKKTVEVPINTTQVAFSGDNFESKTQAFLPMTRQTSVIELEAERDIWSGFKKALGVRNAKEYGLGVTTK